MLTLASDFSPSAPAHNARSATPSVAHALRRTLALQQPQHDRWLDSEPQAASLAARGRGAPRLFGRTRSVTFLAILACASYTTAHADDSAISVISPTTMTRADTRRALRPVTILFAEAGVHISFRICPARAISPRKESRRALEQYNGLLERLARRHSRVLLLVPPQRVGLDVYHGGSANVCGRFAVHTIARSSMPGNPWGLDSFGIAHEVGHLLGAGHRFDNSIMNPSCVDLARKSDWVLSFSPYSIQEIQACNKN